MPMSALAEGRTEPGSHCESSTNDVSPFRLYFETADSILDLSPLFSSGLQPCSGWLCLCRRKPELWHLDQQRLPDPASRAYASAAVKACLSDYWRASCSPQNVLPAPCHCVIPARQCPDSLIQTGLSADTKTLKMCSMGLLGSGLLCRHNQIPGQPWYS